MLKTKDDQLSNVPSTNRSSNADSEGPLVEIPGEDRRGSLGEEAGRVNGLVGVRREAVVAVVHPPVRSHPRSCSCGCTADGGGEGAERFRSAKD